MTWRAMSAWPDPSALFEALGPAIVIRRAGEGDRHAQYCLGVWLTNEATVAAGTGTPMGAGGRSPKAEVGLALRTTQYPIVHHTETC